MQYDNCVTTRRLLQSTPSFPMTAMDIFLLFILAALAFYILRTRDQRQRITLLGRHLQKHQIEKHMERLTDGYLRALSESDPTRRDAIWHLLEATESELSTQVSRLANEFAQVNATDARVSRVPLPFAGRWLPQACFDMRALLTLHAQGLTRLARNESDLPLQQKAYALLAEILLLQHSCHWFCRSKPVASARLLARHQTSYAQVVAAVSPATRSVYQKLIGN